MVQKLHFRASPKLLVPNFPAQNTASYRKQICLRGLYFRHSFRLIFPVLPVENLYFRTGIPDSNGSDHPPSTVSLLPLFPSSHPSWQVPPGTALGDSGSSRFRLFGLIKCVLIRVSRSPRTPFMEFLGVLAAIVLILTPILAISAFVRVQHLAEQLRTFPLQNLAARLAALEKSLASRGTATAPAVIEGPAHAEPPKVAPSVSAPLLFFLMIRRPPR